MPYPEQMELLRDLVVNDHTKIEDEPLLLAVYYASASAPEEECLFEIAHNFGYGEPSEDKHIFQIQFGPSPNFPLPSQDSLRLSLTNPNEFRLAVQEGWPEVQDLQNAIVSGQYEKLYPLYDQDNGAAELWTLLEHQLAPA
jgi:hypothetical protein